MKRVRHLAGRAQGTVPFRVLSAFGASQASNFASALAFSAFLAMFPIILGTLAIVGVAIRDPSTEARFQMFILQIFPGNAQPELQSALRGVRQSAGWMGILSVAGLLWSAIGIFATMEFALTQIFGTKQRNMLRQKLTGLIMMVFLIGALGLMVAANSVGALLSSRTPFAWLFSFLVGAVVMIVLLVLLYRFVPNRTFRIREVLPGALLGGVLIEVLSFVFPLYTRIARGFDSYGAQFALFLLLATWLYLLSNLILLGAVYNRFRLAEPGKDGLIANPKPESTGSERPVDAIRRNRLRKASAAVDLGPPTISGRRSYAQRGVLLVLLSTALAGRLIRRRGNRPGRSIA